MKPLSYATLFGIEGEEETDVAWDKVIDWALDNNIGIVYKEITPRNQAEYLVGDQVTLRYFDYESNAPRIEKVGLKDILDFVVP